MKTTLKKLFTLTGMMLASGSILHAAESAQWIAAESKATNTPNVVTHFRLHLPLKAKPEKFVVLVTADFVYRLAPALGSLQRITARMPHSSGMIQVQLQRTGAAGITGVVTLPPGLSGTFEWGGETIALKPGEQSVRVK